MVCTFVFVLFILYVTGKRTQATDLGSFGPFAICLNLWALSNVDSFTGASLNPALCIAQTIFQCWWLPTNPEGVLAYYMPFYIIGALAGGILAALFYIVYEKAFPVSQKI